MNYDKYNRLELELLELRNKVQHLEVELMLEKQATAHAIGERDRARDTAIALEQEIARVPMIGDAT